MSIHMFLIVTACVFGVVCLLQAVSLLFRWPVQIGSFSVPMYFSALAVAVSGVLCAGAVHFALL